MKLTLKICLAMLIVFSVGGSAAAASNPAGIKNNDSLPKQQIIVIVRHGIVYHIGLIRGDEFTDENRTFGNIYRESLKRGWTLLPFGVGLLTSNGDEFSDQNLKKMGVTYLSVIDSNRTPDKDIFVFSTYRIGGVHENILPNGSRSAVTDAIGAVNAAGTCKKDEAFAFLVPIKLI